MSIRRVWPSRGGRRTSERAGRSRHCCGVGFLRQVRNLRRQFGSKRFRYSLLSIQFSLFFLMSLPSADLPLSRTTFAVRPASLRDAKPVAEIHVAAWQACIDASGPAEARQSVAVDRCQAYWREAIDLCEPQVLVATENERVVGFVGFDRSRDKGTPSTTGELWALYVSPEHWGRGAGLALWDAARDGLQEEGCTKVSIWLPMRFERTMRFVELAGFKREPSSAKTIDHGGARIEEIRLHRSVV